MTEIVLHQWEMSPFCNKVRRCLAHKGLPYRVINYNGLRALAARRLSAAGTLPVLDHGDTRLADSRRIAEFLDRQYPEAPRLYPDIPQAMAAARLWEDWASQSLYFHEIRLRMIDEVARERALDLICAGRPRWERWVLARHFRRHYPAKLREQGIGRLDPAEADAQFFDHLDTIEALLHGRAYLAGLELSIADHSVAAQLSEVLRTSPLADRIRSYTGVRDWLARCDAGAAADAPR